MNFSQKLGLFILILISAAYIYFSFFNKNGFEFNYNENSVPPNETEEFHPADNVEMPQAENPLRK